MRDPPRADPPFARQRAVSVFAACALLLACALLSQAGSQLKWLAGIGIHKQPGFWSVVALAGSAVFALLALLQKQTAVSSNATAADATGAAQSAAPARRPLWEWLGPVEYACYFLLYVYAVPRLGYLPATLIAVLLLTVRLGYRSRRMLCCAGLFGVVIVVLFKSLLQVKIPGGAIYTLLPEAARNFMTLYF